MPIGSTSTLEHDLDSIVGVWSGPSVFTHVVSPLSSGASHPRLDNARPRTPPRASGSASSPISIHSTPSPISRPRAKAVYASPEAKTAFDAPRPVRPLVQFINPPQRQIVPQRKDIHPFFSRDIRRASTAPPLRAPQPHRPRMVAHYSSTSASTSTSVQNTQSTATSLESKAKGKAKSTDVWRVDGFEIELTSYTLPNTQSDTEESEQEEMVEEHVIDEELVKLAESLAEMEIPKSRPTIPPKQVAQPPRAYTRAKAQRKPRSYNVNSGLPDYDHASFSPAPKVAYTCNPDEANDLLSCLRGEVLGFDMEWPTSGQTDTLGRIVGRRFNPQTKKYDFVQPKTALLQFCDENMIVMCHIWHMNRIPEKAVEILSDPKVYKTGVAISNDGKKLLRDYPSAFPNGISSLLELSHLARRVDPINTGPGRGLIALAKLTATYLGKYLDKSRDLRAGNWMLPLSEKAAAYAANDVHAGLYLYLALCDIANANDIPPELPSLALHLPKPEHS